MISQKVKKQFISTNYYKKKIGVLIVVTFFFTLMGLIALNYTHSNRFGDETAHWIGGHLIGKGYALYTDLQFNHQPLNYYFSYFIEKITQPANLFEYISRQRLAIFVYSMIWQIIYLYYFGFYFFVFTIIFEINKYWLSGYKLLGETIAVYPLVFMVLSLGSIVILKNNIKKSAALLVSISSFIVVFALIPLVPLIFFINVVFILILIRKRMWQHAVLAVVPGILMSLVLFLNISFKDYVQETVINNMIYFMPVSGEKLNLAKIWHSFLLPFFSFFSPYSFSKLIISIHTTFFLIFGVISYKAKAFKIWFLFFAMLILANLRVDNFDYSSFHLLPWVGVLFALSVIYSKTILGPTNINKFIKHFFILITYLILIVISFTTSFPLRDKNSRLTDYYNNYSYSETHGNVIKILADTNDRLLVLPSDPMVFWVSNSRPATHVIEYFPWVLLMPKYKNELEAIMKDYPPEFIIDMDYLKSDFADINFEKYLSESYVRLKHLDKLSKIYIHSHKYSKISSDQWNKLELILFSK